MRRVVMFAALLAACGPVDPPVPARTAEFSSLHGSKPDAVSVADAKRGWFTVRGRKTELLVPIDWRMDPHDDRSWRFWLHSWTFLESTLYAAAAGDQEAMRICIDIALDWIENNGQGEQGVSEFAWYDMAVGARAACLGFLVRAARDGAASAEYAAMLLQSAIEHGEWLADDDHYAAAHNHGLFADGGLALLCLQLPELAEARAWHAHAKRRFAGNVAATVSEVDALHLEHSPAYHTMITGLVDRIGAGAGFGDVRLSDLVSRMRARTPWLVLPDGKYAQLGDTHLINAPAWVADHPEPEGLWFARLAGLAAVATPGERLLAVAWYHVRGHKHADELSFVWYARGTRLLVDAGCYGYYYDEPGRKYAESSRSHNVLTRADREFSFRGQPAYGSGLLGAGSGAGWYAIIGHNPLFAAQEVAHRRLWLFRPGELLYVVDLVENRADERPQLRRRFHFGPEVEASHLGDSTWRLAVGDRGVGPPAT